MERVVSKHLFNYELNGIPDAEVFEIYQKSSIQMLSDPAAKAAFEMAFSDDEASPVDPNFTAGFMRNYMSTVYSTVNTHFQEYIDQCEHTEFKVPPRDGNDAEVSVLVHTPKHLVGKPNNAAIIYAHGGGAVSGDAAMMRGPLSRLAVSCGVVYFNVDYRLAPETKCPNNVLDFYCAMKHVKDNAESLGVDESRIAIAGDSGGGYICFATMVMMAQKEEIGLVKLAIPGIPMLGECYNCSRTGN